MPLRYAVPLVTHSSPPSEAGLVRVLGVRQLTAAIVNATVGAGIFVQGIAQPAPDPATWRFTNLLEDRILR